MLGGAYRVEQLKLADARAQLRLSKRELSRRADVHYNLIGNAEKGGTIRRVTAYAILEALNEERTRQGKSALQINDLDWKVSG